MAVVCFVAPLTSVLTAADEAPGITLQPQGLTAIAGCDVGFSASASGTPTPTYEWRKDGSPLDTATNAFLQLPNVSTNDAGDYDVVVSNAAGAATSAVARLVVGIVPDPQLKTALCCGLSRTNCPCVNSPDLASLGSLWACNYQITNLSGLELAVNLTNLCLAANAIADPAPLGGLGRLLSLDLRNNLVADLSALTGLTNLQYLALGDNPVKDYSALAGLTNLAGLSVANLSGRGAPMADLTSLRTLRCLTSLTLWGNLIGDISPLAGLTNLSCLDLRWNAVTNPFVLSGMTNLDRLYLGATSISNIHFLRPLTRLALLNLADNRISDLRPLAGLTNLTYLVLSGNSTLTDYSPLNGMGGLVNLELRGNGITNLVFLTNLIHLAYADLAYNNITDPSPLAGPTNLALVLDGNTNLDYVTLSGLKNISRLWLNGNAINDVGFLRDMPQLIAVGLDNNEVADPSPLSTLTNLVLLGLSRNPILDYNRLTNLALASLRLEGNSISNTLGFLSRLPQLAFLSLNNNSIRDLSALGGLTNLSSLYLAHNRLCDISPLTALPQLRFVDVSLNLLETNAAREVADILRCPWVTTGEANIEYQPTDGLIITADPLKAPEWHIPANRTRSMDFYISDDLVPPEEWSVTATNWPDSVIPNANITLSSDGSGWTVTLHSAPVEARTNAILTLTVQDSHPPNCGLITSTNITVQVWPADPDFSIPDPSLSNLVWQALGGPADGFTSVDMLSLVSLVASGAGITNLFGLQWATNLAYLDLSQNRLSDITPLINLPSLSYVDLRWNLLDVADNPALQVLTNDLSLTNALGNELLVCPQRTPPWIDVRTDWLVAAGETSSIPVAVWDSGPADQQLEAGATSLSAGLAVCLTQDTTQGVNNLWTLAVIPTANATTNQITLAATNDVGLFTIVTNEVWVAAFAPTTGSCPWLSDPSLTWSTDGDASWFGQSLITRNGQTTAQSGALGNNQESVLQTTVNGPGTLTFWWKVSSETNYDWLEFFIGDALVACISGEVDWNQEAAKVPPGLQTLQWQYSKDTDTSVGLDSGWLADVVFTPDFWVEVAGSPTNNQCQLILRGIPGNLCAVQTCTNLADPKWVELDPLVIVTNSTMPFTDTNAALGTRFYRAVVSP